MRDIWIFLFALGVVLFNWPILSIFGSDLFKYLFTAWLLFIGALFFTTAATKKKKRGD